ncbi:hypothetical protein NHX12_018183, partial [Muraenolepis orangiensis]
MKFDHVLSEIGGFGRFQVVLVLIQAISRLSLPCHFLLNNFMAVVPAHHCALDLLDPFSLDLDPLVSLDHLGTFQNLTLDQRQTVGAPRRQDGSPDPCLVYLEPQYQLLSNKSKSSSPHNKSNTTSTQDLPVVQCKRGWVYENSTFRSTIVTEWDLVCSRKGLDKATATIFFIGVMCGAPLFGFLSDRAGHPFHSDRDIAGIPTASVAHCNDRLQACAVICFRREKSLTPPAVLFGRRRVLLASYLATLAFASASSLCRSYPAFVVLRGLTGLAIAGISIIPIVL